MAKASESKVTATTGVTATPGNLVRPAQDAPAQPPVIEGAPPVAEPAKPVLTADQKKGLFVVFDAAVKELAAAEQALDAAKSKKSASIKAIVDGFGRPGPFQRADGRILNAARIKSSTVDGVVVPGGWTFREEKKQEPEVV